MSQEKPFDRAIEDDHFDVLVSFDRGDDLAEVWNGVRAKDVKRRVINRYAPVVGRALREMYLFSHCHVNLLPPYFPSFKRNISGKFAVRNCHRGDTANAEDQYGLPILRFLKKIRIFRELFIAAGKVS